MEPAVEEFLLPAVPQHLSGRRAFCGQFKLNQQDDISSHRDTFTSWSRRLPHHLSVEEGDTVRVPHPSPKRRSKMPVGQEILPPVLKEMDRDKVIRGVLFPPAGRKVSCKQLKEENLSLHQTTNNTWCRKLSHRLRTEDCETVRVPQPPPKWSPEMEPVGRVHLHRGPQQSNILPVSKHSGVGVSHPPFRQSVHYREFKEEQKDKPSLHRNTFSSWCRRPVQLPDCLRREEELVKNGTDSQESNNLPVIHQTDDEDPHPKSEWLAICKEYKEEKKDLPSIHQDTYSTWSRQLPRIRRKESITHSSDIRFSRFTKVPDIEETKSCLTEKDMCKLFILLDKLKEKERRKNIPESPDHKDAHTLPEQDSENGKNEYVTFSKSVAEGCWDLWCVKKFISKNKAALREESGNIDSHSTSTVENFAHTTLLGKFVSFGRNLNQRLANTDKRSSSSTSLWDTTDDRKLLGKLQFFQEHLHFSLRSFIEEQEIAHKLNVTLATELEYENIERRSEFYRMFKELALKLMLPDWQEQFQMNPEDPFYFEDPQDLIHWMRCLEMSDLLGNEIFTQGLSGEDQDKSAPNGPVDCADILCSSTSGDPSSNPD